MYSYISLTISKDDNLVTTSLTLYLQNFLKLMQLVVVGRLPQSTSKNRDQDFGLRPVRSQLALRLLFYHSPLVGACKSQMADCSSTPQVCARILV
jgi:hypothetical protein